MLYQSWGNAQSLLTSPLLPPTVVCESQWWDWTVFIYMQCFTSKIEKCQIDQTEEPKCIPCSLLNRDRHCDWLLLKLLSEQHLSFWPQIQDTYILFAKQWAVSNHSMLIEPFCLKMKWLECSCWNVPSGVRCPLIGRGMGRLLFCAWRRYKMQQQKNDNNQEIFLPRQCKS